LEPGIFYLGIIGSVLLVLGAAWPEPVKEIHPIRSMKNWFFAMGGWIMFAYALVSWQAGGAFFFVILETMVVISSVLMLSNAKEKLVLPLLGILSLILIAWSFSLFEGFNTLFFIIGLAGIGLGYTLQAGTVRRHASLTMGSILICVFSFIEASWVFFWLNLFFALFSGYYLFRSLRGN
jgi:hypothetical protein